MIILGVDPGLQHTGWGAILSESSRLRFLASGTLHTASRDPLERRLRTLHDGLSEVLAQIKPDQAAIEETFVSVNGQSTLKLGQARGALLLTLAMAEIPVYAYAPRLVKKTLTGVGKAEKGQMQWMVNRLLPIAQYDSADAADALAIALCHAQHA